MNHTTTVLSQILSFLPKNKFNRILGQHEKVHGNRVISTWQQLILMLFVQSSGCESLRQLEMVWRSQGNKWYHLGIESVSRSTLSDANRQTNPDIFEKVFYELVSEYRSYLPHKKFSFEEDLYLLDGSIVSLVYSLFDWAKYRRMKGAIRLHVLFCATEQIPCWLNVTNGKNPHEVEIARNNWESWNLPSGCILCFDRGLIDYKWWYELHKEGIYWLTRAKSNTHFFATKTYKSDHPQVIDDEEGYFVVSEQDYPKPIRRVRWYDPKQDKELVFLTNNHDLAPEQIAEAYKARWQIELFFKWIKQHLKIKTFLGTSQNAVLSQIWTAMIYFIIISYIKAKTKIKQSIFLLTKIFAQALFEYVHIIELLNTTPKKARKLISARASPQLSLL